MKSLIQHIKADGSSLISLEEKLRIGKDWKPEAVQDIISLFDDNYDKEYPVDNFPGFFIDTNGTENYETIVKAVNEMGTNINGDFDNILDNENEAFVGWHDLESGNVDFYDEMFYFAMRYNYGIIEDRIAEIHINLSPKQSYIKAGIETPSSACARLSHFDNMCNISTDDFMTLLEYVVDHGGLHNKVALRKLIDRWNKK